MMYFLQDLVTQIVQLLTSKSCTKCT